MQGSMYTQQGMPLLPQLGPAHMDMGYTATQQSFAPPAGRGLQGPNQATSRRGPGRQAGSALPVPDLSPAGSPYGNYPQQQQQQQQQHGMIQNWGSPFAASQQAFPMQYAQSPAAMGASQGMLNSFGGYPAAAPGVYPGVQSTSMLPRRAKSKANAFGPPSMQQGYAAAPTAGPMQPAGYPSQPMPQMGGYPQMAGAGPWGNGAAMQQRADVMQQYQLQHYQQTQNNVMQHLQQNQNHALLKYGNFDHATYSQSDLNSRPEFRTY